jgi:hypothetical protein
LVERVTVSDAGAEIRLNLEGLAGLAEDTDDEAAGGDSGMSSVATVLVPDDEYAGAVAGK